MKQATQGKLGVKTQSSSVENTAPSTTSTSTVTPSVPVQDQAGHQDQTHLSLTEALAVLVHLTDRGLLCSKCGYGWAVWDNQMHALCDGCKDIYPNMTFTPRSSAKGSTFERILSKSLGRWVAAFIQDRGAA